MQKLKQVSGSVVSTMLAGAAPAVARVVDVPGRGRAVLRIGDRQPVEGRLAAELARCRPESLLGLEVVVLFEGNDPEKPIALALLQAPSDFTEALQFDSEDANLDARVDGEHVVIEAKKKLELRVGKASIVIDEQGKITIRGAHLLNRATGPIRIKGGHVDIN